MKQSDFNSRILFTYRNSRSMSAYISELVKCSKVMSDDEEQDAFNMWYDTNDKKYFDKIVLSNLRLVLSIAKEYVCSDYSLCDMISEGNIGLMRAVETYDMTKGFRFCSYASWWIRASIIRFLSNNASTVKIPENVGREARKVHTIIDSFTARNGREPSLDEIVELSGKSEDELRDLIYVSNVSCNSLNEKVGDDEDSAEQSDFLKDDFMSQSDLTDILLFPDALSEEMERILSVKEEMVIRGLFGIGGEHLTEREISDILHISVTRVLQLKSNALLKLRSSSLLRDYKNIFD